MYPAPSKGQVRWGLALKRHSLFNLSSRRGFDAINCVQSPSAEERSHPEEDNLQLKDFSVACEFFLRRSVSSAFEMTASRGMAPQLNQPINCPRLCENIPSMSTTPLRFLSRVRVFLEKKRIELLRNDSFPGYGSSTQSTNQPNIGPPTLSNTYFPYCFPATVHVTLKVQQPKLLIYETR